MPGIISTDERVSFLEQKYEGLRIPVYKLRKWVSEDKEVFFDCGAEDKATCLRRIMTEVNLSAFVIYLLVKDVSTGELVFMDVSFRNIGKESFEHFIARYHQQLESMTKLSLQTAGLEYVAC